MKKLLIVSVILFSTQMAFSSEDIKDTISDEGIASKRAAFLNTVANVFYVCSDYHALGFARKDGVYIIDKSVKSCVMYGMHQRLCYLLGESTPGVRTPSRFKHHKADLLLLNDNLDAGARAVEKWMDSSYARDIAISKINDYIEERSGIRPEARTGADIKQAYGNLWLGALQELKVSQSLEESDQKFHGIGLVKKNSK